MPKGLRGFQKGNKLGQKFGAKKKHWNWGGGFRIITCGNGKTKYKKILKRDHPHADGKGYIMEHRLVMEKKIGRYLKPEEKVHHKDGNGLNNKIINLKLYGDASEHNMHHRWGIKWKRKGESPHQKHPRAK